MNIARKMDITKTAIDSIATHEDADSQVRKASLDALVAYVEAAKTAIDARKQAEITEALG